LALSKKAQPKQSTPVNYAVSVASLAVSLFSAFAYSLGTYGE
jgi:hypothetical protein